MTASKPLSTQQAGLSEHAMGRAELFAAWRGAMAATKKPARGGLYLSEFFDLGFDLLERSFQRRAAGRARRSLREDVLPL